MSRLMKIVRHYPLKQLLSYLGFRMKLFCVHFFPFFFSRSRAGAGHAVRWAEPFYHRQSFADGEFTFLNLSEKFTTEPDWSFSGHGKLWNYQLQSFEFLLQENMQRPDAEKLMTGFASFIKHHPSCFEPYPASLRVINWVKFLSVGDVQNDVLSECVLEDASRIAFTAEWHLENNHLLENGFALIFAGIFMDDEGLFGKGKTIVEGGLRKQILPDGGHFELSPMYHQQVLYRVLDCIQLLNKNRSGEKEFIQQLSTVAGRMSGWMNEINFENGEMPLVNDSANGIAPASALLNSYAASLNIQPAKISLHESGFRKIRTGSYECLIHTGAMEAGENAGHRHSDALHFLLSVSGAPFIIDTGISTYEKNGRRLFERSTAAHNTVSIDGLNQDEIWDAFRVGKRAEIFGRNSGPGYYEASVRFSGHSMIHTRRFEFSENALIITDHVSGGNLNDPKTFFYIEKKSQLAHAKSKFKSIFADIEFTGDAEVNVDHALVSSQFNRMTECNRLTVQFKNTLITTFTFHNILIGR